MTTTIERFVWDGRVWNGAPPETMSVGEMIEAFLEKPKDPPPHIAQRLSEHWGATSLHGMVFRRPKGFIWWHCDKCRMRSTPSGRRSLELPARGVGEMEAACALTVRLRQVERDRFTACLGRPERVMSLDAPTNSGCTCQGLSFYSPACHPACPAAKERV